VEVPVSLVVKDILLLDMEIPNVSLAVQENTTTKILKRIVIYVLKAPMAISAV